MSNQDQVDFWNGPRAAQWVAGQAVMDRQLGPFGDAALAAARVTSGERVIDVGCGCGDTSLAVAQAVGPSGAVLGVDVSVPMLARARMRAASVPQIRFEQADASAYPFAGDADCVFSRFGVMFFEDPQAAFSNLHRALKPGGRLAFVCWRPLVENAWMNVPLAAAGSVIPSTRPPAAPDAPGPYALSDPDRVRAILSGAGFRQIALAPFDCDVSVGSGAGLEAAVEECITVGPAARLFLEASPELQGQARAAVRDALRPFLRGHEVPLQAAAWIVTASA